MKNITKVVVLALVMIVFHVNTYAQKSEQQRMTREQLAETQAQFIANEMAMDNKTSRQFVETSPVNASPKSPHWMPVVPAKA
jgi:hypothetical protein